MAEVRVVDTQSGEVVWRHELTGQPFIEYVPWGGFKEEEAGFVRIEWDEVD